MSDLADNEVGTKVVTQDLSKSESSLKVRLQVLRLHGLGMVPTKVVQPRKMPFFAIDWNLAG